MRSAPALLVAACLLVAAGCGGSGGDTETAGVPGGGDTLEELWQAPGEDVAVIPGTANHMPGDVRVSFLVVDSKGGAEATGRRAAELHRSFQAIFGIRAVLGQSWRMLGWWDSAVQARQADIVVELPVPLHDGFNFGAVERLVDLGRSLAEPRMPSIRQAFYEMIRPGSP